MRKPIIAANWKMNMTATQTAFFLQSLEEKLRFVGDDVEVVVCPPFTDLKTAATVIEADNLKIELGAQDMFWEEKGAYTGEISAAMLKDLLVEYVIIGHSERRQYFGETDETVNKKVKAALANNLKPIVCVGETLEQHQQGQTEQVVQEQLRAGLVEVPSPMAAGLVLAYEPIWAIGTGRNASPAEANAVIGHMRSVISSIFSPAVADRLRIQYGGSVKPDNIAALMSQPEIDGALVGGAGLNADDFSRIVFYKK